MSDTEAQQLARRVTSDVLRHANKLHGFLQGLSATELAERVNVEAARWNDSVTSVIVAGDIKRGKSSLVNSLVGHTALLPVDADVATSVHLVVRHGERLEAQVTRLVDGTPETLAIDPTDIASYASMRGDEAMRQGVTDVEIRLPHPLLERGLAVIDTPGVGGMSQGHRDITMAALQRADALLFTISSQEPVSRSELQFLAQASRRIDAVIFVVTKADLNTDDQNQALVDDIRARLGTHRTHLIEHAGDDAAEARELAERFDRLLHAPVVLTSSYVADQAAVRAERGRADAAERLRDRSGLPRLEHLLERSIDTREDVRLANILQVSSILLAEVEEEQRARVRAINGDRSIEDEMDAKQAQLEQFASQQARWRTSLATGIQRLQTGAGRKVSRELNLVRNHYREVLESASDVEQLTATLPEELERSLHAAWNNLAESSTRDFESVIADLLEEFGIEGMETVLGDLQMPDGLRDLIDSTSDGSGDAFDLLEDGIPATTQTFLFGNMANSVVGTLGIATGGLGLAAYGIGAALALPIVALRRKQRQRKQTVSEYHRIVNEALFGQEGIAKEFTTELTLRIIDARQQIEELVEQRLVQRRKQLEQRRVELQQLLKTEVASRQRSAREADKTLAELAQLRAEGTKLRTLVERSLRNDPALTETSDADAASDEAPS